MFAELGADITVIGAEPDGLNINADCGSTHPERLQSEVLARGADLGIAFDGDGDRLLMVDHDGVVLDGDELLFIVARHRSEAGRLAGGVVGTLMSNFGMEQALAAAVDSVRANEGRRPVHSRRAEETRLGSWAEKGRDISCASI